MVLALQIEENFGLDIRPENRQAVFNHVVESQNPAFLIETDIMNASGLNQALGHAQANRVLSIGWQMQKEALAALNPDVLYMGKPNGDETSTIISGDIKEAAVEEALKLAQSKFDAFLNDAGLHSLEHHRDHRDAGVKNVYAFLQINESEPAPETLSKMVSDLHEGIGQQKYAFGIRDENAVTTIESFKTNTSIEKALKAIEAYELSSPNADFVIPDDIQTISDRDHVAVGIMQALHQRKEDFEAVRHDHDGVEKHIIRFDAHSLNALNNKFGRNGADQIIDSVHAIAKDTAKSYDADFKSYAIEARQLDIIVKGHSDDIANMKLAIYQAIAETHGSVPIMMASTAINPERAYDVTMQRLDDSLEVNKLHKMALFYKQDGHVHCHGLDGTKPTIVNDIDYPSDSTIPFARSAVSLMDAETLAQVLEMRAGEIMRSLYGVDFEGVLARHVPVKDLLRDGVASEQEVLTQLEQSQTMAQFDEWLDQKTQAHKHAYNSADNNSAERSVAGDVKFMSGTMSKAWMPVLLGVTYDEYDLMLETAMQGQACLRHVGDASYQSASYADNVQEAKSLLLNDVLTHMPHIQNKQTRQLQSAGQAIRALHFMSVLKDVDLEDEERQCAINIISDGLNHCGDVFCEMGDGHDNVGQILKSRSGFLNKQYGANPQHASQSMDYLGWALSEDARIVAAAFEPEDRERFQSNINAVLVGLGFDKVALDLTPDFAIA